jgi:hypothetical protein
MAAMESKVISPKYGYLACYSSNKVNVDFLSNNIYTNPFDAFSVIISTIYKHRFLFGVSSNIKTERELISAVMILKTIRGVISGHGQFDNGELDIEKTTMDVNDVGSFSFCTRGARDLQYVWLQYYVKKMEMT